MKTSTPLLFAKECSGSEGPILPDPDEVGKTEYGVAYEIIRVLNNRASKGRMRNL